ncbi:hypothetical protein BZG01_00020 [Labilibaculum manganireducens]|uniref:Integrase catalytic domain-containing protein n=1 Tax=Labilibaculum manganireducens TaxID=1940525 RepID=A0A2N3IGG0_9BACT|nr:hypothetical protein [Labilibaculum manganireducens]PKQ69358.1 hypothetical protein BZG01_00020 [Labilibaculum manganireducens]
MEYYNNILCVEGGWLYGAGDVMSKYSYDANIRRGWIKVERRACKGTPALIAYDSIPERFKKVIVDKFGDPHKTTKHNQFKSYIVPDAEALEFYSAYRLPDGRALPEKAIQEYCTNASFLNALLKVESNKGSQRRALGGSARGIWEKLASVVDRLKDEYPHTLPANSRRLKDRLKAYKKDGYMSLVHKNYCNDNSRKVSADLEHLILSLYTLPNKPFSSSVHDMYLQFLGGAIDVADSVTGELFDREAFIDKNGMPILVSDSTIWNYINNPKNRAIVDNVRNDGHYYNDMHRPHHHRHAPAYSLSKISMDDRDLPRKMKDGNRAKAYYAYDVASGCVIGASYSRLKDKSLFIDCIRDMFRNIYNWGYGMPMEVEVEHHLVNNYKDDLMKAGTIFPFVRWCNPGNSQEKRAEHFNRAKKYGYEKKYQDGIGRFYSKLEANRPKQEKIFDEHNDNYKEKTFTFDELVADDLFIIEKFNNRLHPKQKLYKGLTRMEVMQRNLNPNLANIDKPVLAKCIGEKVKTTIRRSQYVRVQYADYQLPSPQVLEMLEPNNYSVVAYYIPEKDQTIGDVYLYQDGDFIAKCEKIETYNEAKAEQTEKDDIAYQNQAKYVAEFDKMTKTGKKKLSKIHVIDNAERFESVKAEMVKIPTLPNNKEDFEECFDEDFYSSGNAINDL